MPYARPHALLSVSGTHYGVDRFTFGLRLNNVAGTFPAGQAEQQALCSDYSEAVKTWWQSQSISGSGSRLDLVKLNEIGIDGKYVNGWTNFDEHNPSVSGQGSSVNAPQVALVATLSTGNSRGLATKGRIYLPSPTYQAAPSEGTIPAEQALEAATSVAGLLTSLNAVDPGRVVVVCSPTRAGAERTVSEVQVGRTLDTMRSRRSAFSDKREGFALAGGAGFQFP